MNIYFSFLPRSLHRISGIFPLFLVVLILSMNSWAVTLKSPKPLMRFPDIHGERIVFVYGEDIWTAPSNGGIATRLTIHDGEERFPKFSPDGKLIAFTGEYDGNSDVYVMTVFGGDITRVTFHPGTDEVIGWHPIKKKIIFSSRRHSYNWFSRLFLISPDGTGLEELILHEAVAGSFSSDGTQIAFNKVSRENRTWKRYRGGTAQEVYLYDFKTNKEKNLTNFRGTDRIPMWIGDKIYFSSDRDRILNIYSYHTRSGKIEKLTHHSNYDVRRPSKGENKIVYELAGSIWILDIKTKISKKVPVEIRTDAPELRPHIKKVSKYITGFDCSPSGKRALIVARGEIFSAPRKEGPIRNLTKDSGSRDKDAVWSPDGKTIAYISDRDGENEIYLIDSMGKNRSKKLTRHTNGYRHTLRWSPDSKKIAFADHTLSCYYLDIQTKNVIKIDKAEYENVDLALDAKPIYDFSWSPDSRFVAYSKMGEDLVTKIYIYSLETGQTRCVSHGIFNDFNPVFSQDGKYLFFISNRRFNPTYCDFEWEMVYKNVAGIYSLTLRKHEKSFLPFKSDEEEKKAVKKSSDKGKKGKAKYKKKAEKMVRIDFKGLSDRIEALPLKPGNYRNLAVSESSIFYLNADKGDFNRFEFRSLGPRDLCAYSFKKRKQKTVIKGIDGYKLSADSSHVIYKKKDAIGFIEVSKDDLNGQKEIKGKKVDLSDLKMKLDPVREWKQIFNEAWRLERDFYYDPNMHGLDWPAMKKKYAPLVDSASCRQDIRFIVGELIGELNTSHTYVYAGDRQRKAKRVNVGMLGVDWEIDGVNNRYRFKKIYRIPDWSRDVMPPLAKPGLNVTKGFYLLKVNGDDVLANRNIYSYFQDLVGKQVTLLINSRPTLIGSREITVKPLRSEWRLRYLAWVEHNRLVVEKKSNGLIGYIHLPDTYVGSSIEFPKYFYSQTRKKGLIVDGRFNGGGLDPDIFLQRLDKKILTYWTRRYSHDQTTPFVVTRAHMVCLTNKQAGSGGDMLPMEFQMRKMGPVIGTRTWGGLVGVSTFIQMIDGGGLTAPDYRIYDTKGKWIVENTGVKPDIVVDLNSLEVSRGHDAQLMTGIKYLMEKIKKEPRPWPEHESFEIDK